MEKTSFFSLKLNGHPLPYTEAFYMSFNTWALPEKKANAPECNKSIHRTDSVLLTSSHKAYKYGPFTQPLVKKIMDSVF